MSCTENSNKSFCKSTGGDLVKFSKLTALFLTLLVVTAQFPISSRAQDQTAGNVTVKGNAALKGTGINFAE
jgi:hypothetical protein